MKIGVSLIPLPILGTLPLVGLSSLHMRAFALAPCTLFCHVCLLSFGGFLFPERKWRGSGLKEKEK